MMLKQSRFAFMVAILIIFASIKGYQITFGDAWQKRARAGRTRKAPSILAGLMTEITIPGEN